VYAGYSAGVCVTGPDLDGCHLMDEPDLIPVGYSSDESPTTLGWLPWRIVPHWRSDHEEAPLAELAVEHLLATGLPFQTLQDGQVFVIDGDDRFLV
jgi:dipeptidase E